MFYTNQAFATVARKRVTGGGGVGTAPSASDCVAYWKLEDLNDATANNYDLTNFGADSTSGKISNGYSFISSNEDYMNVPASLHNTASTSDGLYGASQISMGFWVNRQGDFGNDQLLYYAAVSASSNFYILFNSSNQFDVRLRSATSDSIKSAQSTTAISSSGWHYCSFVADYASDEIRVYVDGVLETTGSVTFNAITYNINTSNILHIGKHGSSIRYTTAIVDEISVFNTGLTTDNMVYLYQEGSPGSAQQYPFT